MSKDEKSLKDELFAAVTYDDVKTLKSLIKDGADINAIKYRETPLTLALRLKHKDIINELIQDPKIDFQAQNTKGETPLSLALKWQHRDTINARTQSGIDINISKDIVKTLRKKLENEQLNTEVQTSIETQNIETETNTETQSSDNVLTPKEYKFGKNSKVYKILMNSDSATIARKLSIAFRNKNTDVYLDGNEIFQTKFDGDVHMPYFSIEKIIDECPPELVQKIGKISEKINYKNKVSLSSVVDKIKNFFTIVFSLGSSGVKDRDIAIIFDKFKPEIVNLGSIGSNQLRPSYKNKAEGLVGDITSMPNRFKQIELNAIKKYFASDVEKVFSITESLYATSQLLPASLRPLNTALAPQQLKSFTVAIKDNADVVAKLLSEGKKEELKKSTEGIIKFLEKEHDKNFLKDQDIDNEHKELIKQATQTTFKSLTNELVKLKRQAIKINEVTGTMQDFQTAIRKNLNNQLGSKNKKEAKSKEQNSESRQR